MKKSALALATIFAVLSATSTHAGRDELQTQVIRKAIEAKQVAQKNGRGRTALTSTHPWWHPKLGSVPKT